VIRRSPSSGSRAATASATTRAAIAPTVRQAIRSSTSSVDFDVRVAIHATVSYENPGVPGTVPCPQHRRHHDPMLTAGDPRRVALRSARPRRGRTAARHVVHGTDLWSYTIWFGVAEPSASGPDPVTCGHLGRTGVRNAEWNRELAVTLHPAGPFGLAQSVRADQEVGVLLLRGPDGRRGP